MESKGRYGAPKIHQTLLMKGFEPSINRVQRLMRQAGIFPTIQTNIVPIRIKKTRLKKEKTY